MKKILLSTFLLMFEVSTIFAAQFTPTVLQLSVPEVVHYNFDGSRLGIPVTVGGTDASYIFLVFTKDQAMNIGRIQNGYLGWHYVNRVDTCIYASAPDVIGVGTTSVGWHGRDQDGNAVPPGDYTYYIWAYDSFSEKLVMTNQIGIFWWMRNTIITHDENGVPLANPVIYRGDAENDIYGNTEQKSHDNQKWIVGGDPDDPGLVETCSTVEWNDSGGLAFHPDDHRYFFKCSLNGNQEKVVRKWEWIPNSKARLQTGWGNEGEYKFPVCSPKNFQHGPGVISDGGDYLFVVNGDNSRECFESELIYVDINDGTEITRLDLTDWYDYLGNAETGGREGSGPTCLKFKHDTLFTGASATCMNLMIDPYWIADEILWANQNGDYTGDKNFDEHVPHQWICNDMHYVLPFKYSISPDDNLFSIFPSPGIPDGSFGLYAPDGTGLDYHSFAGENSLSKHTGMEIIDYGSAYDGIYTIDVTGNSVGITGTYGWQFIAHDSIKGVISSSAPVSADEFTPFTWVVNQNHPNPFNLTTTISYSIAEAGNVTVDVYSTAGQKVERLVNEFKDAGKHSVVWDASGFSAGVYFYTVKSGEFSKTMNMTLLK